MEWGMLENNIETQSLLTLFSIPVGKMSLYIGVGGFSPEKTLPMLLDVGTNNKKVYYPGNTSC